MKVKYPKTAELYLSSRDKIAGPVGPNGDRYYIVTDCYIDFVTSEARVYSRVMQNFVVGNVDVEQFAGSYAACHTYIVDIVGHLPVYKTIKKWKSLDNSNEVWNNRASKSELLARGYYTKDEYTRLKFLGSVRRIK